MTPTPTEKGTGVSEQTKGPGLPTKLTADGFLLRREDGSIVGSTGGPQTIHDDDYRAYAVEIARRYNAFDLLLAACECDAAFRKFECNPNDMQWMGYVEVLTKHGWTLNEETGQFRVDLRRRALDAARGGVGKP